MRSMWFATLVAFIVTFGLVMGFAHSSEIYEDTSRHVGFGVSGGGNTGSLSVTGVVPYEDEKWKGWLGGYAQQINEGTEIQSQTINARTEAGYKFTERISVNGFVDGTRDKLRGIDRQMQVGGFVLADVLETDLVSVSVGVGNYLENKTARADLELEDTDPTVVRLLAYGKVSGYGQTLIIKTTPQIDFSDLQVELQPKFAYSVAENIDLALALVVGYETKPLDPDKNIYGSYTLQGVVRF